MTKIRSRCGVAGAEIGKDRAAIVAKERQRAAL